MRYRMTLTLSPLNIATPAGSRHIEDSDLEALAQLMLAAYRGTVDDSGETIDDARAEIRKTFAGHYGPLDRDASLVLKQDDQLAAAVLITRFEDAPFVSFCMTAPAFKRQGLCRALLSHIINTLHARGESRLTLFVTAENNAALRLYQSMGFATP